MKSASLYILDTSLSITCGDYTDFRYVCGDTSTSGDGSSNTDTSKNGVSMSECKTWCASQGTGCCEYTNENCLYKETGVLRYSDSHAETQSFLCIDKDKGSPSSALRTVFVRKFLNYFLKNF